MAGSDERLAGPTELAGQITLAFGPFRLVPSQKILLENDMPVRLGGRAMDILIALASRAGEIVSKNDLIDYVWPSTFVEENNLRVHLAALRKILGDGQDGVRYIINVPARGYSFVAPVSRVGATTIQYAPAPLGAAKLPAQVTRLIGRSAVIAELGELLEAYRFVSIVAPGGMGKSSVALAVAETCEQRYRDGARFVDLAAVDEADKVADAISTALGLSLLSGEKLAGLTGFLRDRSVLLLLDNCEHLVATIAELAEAIFIEAPDVAMLVTSREPLRSEGERIYSLPALAFDNHEDTTSAAGAMASPAVQLFVERATATMESFVLADADAASVMQICQRLDGNALAIELAAARINIFGVEGLLERLSDVFLILTEGKRTAQPRHRNLRAMLDWSYDLLTPDEQQLLRRLSVFRSAFSMEAAIAIAADHGSDETPILGHLSSLAAKSLISINASADRIAYRLLDITRNYASEKLAQSGEQPAILHRHAQYLIDTLGRADETWETMRPSEWQQTYSVLIDDVRAAIDWSLSARQTTPLGIQLTANALPLGFQLSLIDEFRVRGEQALKHLDATEPRDLASELVIASALSGVTQQTTGGGRMVDFANRALELADQLHLHHRKIGVLVARWTHPFGAGDYKGAMACSDELSAVAVKTDDALAMVTADRVRAQSLHYSGHHAEARILATRTMEHRVGSLPLSHSPIPISRQVSMRIILARVLWIQGFPDRAVRIAHEALALAETDTPLAVSQALALACCPIAFWRGDLDTAATLITRLKAHATQVTAAYWYSWALCFESALAFRLAGVALPPTTPTPPLAGLKQMDNAATIASALTTPETILRAEQGEADWSAPEILRIKGAMAPNQAAAEAAFSAALALARQQGALSWELRIATSLARLRISQNRAAEAADLLTPVLARFSEGHDTTDLMAASHLLASLRQG